MTWAVTADPLRFLEAEAWLRARVPMTAEEFYALEGRARRKAFTVSGVAQLDLIAEVQRSLEAALADGTPFEEWQKQIGPRLTAAWGGAKPWRLKTIFQTNVQAAYSSGRVAQMTDPDVAKARPYWMFDAILDANTTGICRSLNGTVRPLDDPWWQTHQPPLHFGCRSGLRSLTRREAEAKGVADEAPDISPASGFGDLAESWEWEPGPAKAEQLRAVRGRALREPAEVRAAMRVVDGQFAAALEQLEQEIQRLTGQTGREAVRDLAAAFQRRRELGRERGKALRALLYHRQPPEITATVSAKATKAKLAEAIEQGVWEFGKLTGLAGSVEFRYITESPAYRRGVRSHFLGGVVYLAKGEGVGTVVHELGHWWEAQRPDHLRAAGEWMDGRTVGEAAQPLKSLTGLAYGRDEVSKPDRFWDAYVGKVYARTGQRFATEVSSMGLEWLYEKPLEFAAADPDMFDAVLKWTQ